MASILWMMSVVAPDVTVEWAMVTMVAATMIIAAHNALAARPEYPGALFNLAFAQALAGKSAESLATLDRLLAKGIDYGVARIPWAASGRALSLGRDEGFTKLLFDKQTDRVLGGAIVGPNAGDLVAEIGLAIEMGADAEDIALSIHPHPTLSETVANRFQFSV